MSEVRLIQSHLSHFYLILLNKHPKRFSYTTLYHLARSMVLSEKRENLEEKEKKRISEYEKKLDFIYNYTHIELNRKLPFVELSLYKNLEERGLNREITIDGSTFNVVELYYFLEKAIEQLTEIVLDIAKNYNVDLPINSDLTGGGSIKSITPFQ